MWGGVVFIWIIFYCICSIEAAAYRTAFRPTVEAAGRIRPTIITRGAPQPILTTRIPQNSLFRRAFSQPLAMPMAQQARTLSTEGFTRPLYGMLHTATPFSNVKKYMHNMYMSEKAEHNVDLLVQDHKREMSKLTEDFLNQNPPPSMFSDVDRNWDNILDWNTQRANAYTETFFKKKEELQKRLNRIEATPLWGFLQREQLKNARDFLLQTSVSVSEATNNARRNLLKKMEMKIDEELEEKARAQRAYANARGNKADTSFEVKDIGMMNPQEALAYVRRSQNVPENIFGVSAKTQKPEIAAAVNAAQDNLR